MRPDTIIIHCSATRENANFTVEQVDMSHKIAGYKRSVPGKLKHIGYQYYIRKDGKIFVGRNEDEVGAHTKDHNSHSIGICYEGGLDANGKEKDTRTEAQKVAIIDLIRNIQTRWEIKAIIGHRDVSPDLNGNGVVDTCERIKACPCFDAIPEYKYLLI